MVPKVKNGKNYRLKTQPRFHPVILGLSMYELRFGCNGKQHRSSWYTAHDFTLYYNQSTNLLLDTWGLYHKTFYSRIFFVCFQRLKTIFFRKSFYEIKWRKRFCFEQFFCAETKLSKTFFHSIVVSQYVLMLFDTFITILMIIKPSLFDQFWGKSMFTCVKRTSLLLQQVNYGSKCFKPWGHIL